MINFIIYEDDKKFRETYIYSILKIIGSMKIAYKIVEIDKYDDNTIGKIESLIGKKIFILDIEVPGKTGIDLAREIRNNGDWKSPMIIVTTHEQLKISTFTSKMLMLDFISKFYNCENSLQESVKIAIDIVTSHKSLNFEHNGELYQIPYEDILFIEKNVDDMYSTIVTKKGRIRVKRMLITLEKQLIEATQFFRTHRSCIINVHNLTSLELSASIMHFGDIENPLLSRDRKRGLKLLLGKKAPKSPKKRTEEVR